MPDDDLAASLAGLAGVLTGNGPTTDTLVEIAALAVHTIPGADGAGLTMLDNDRPQTVVASAEFRARRRRGPVHPRRGPVPACGCDR